MSIRSRLVILCVVVALLPAIPLSFLVRSLLEKSFNLGLSTPIEQALQNGIAVSRDHLGLVHDLFENDVAMLVSRRELSPGDSTALAEELASVPKVFRRIDGFLFPPQLITEGGGDGARFAHALGDLPKVRALTGDARVIPRGEPTAGDAGIAYFDTEDRTVQLAVWHPGGANGDCAEGFDRPVLFYDRIDDEFIERTNNLLSGLQLFTQLRLSQPTLSRSFFYPFIVVYGVILLLSLALALLMSERLAQPVRRLSVGVREVARGNWSHRVEARSGGEVGHLIDAFNWMVSRLEDQHRRLIDLEKMATWREMARHLAHEVKNPLLPIRLTVQELRDQYRGEDADYKRLVHESVRVIEDELANLQKLVKEFSSFARMPDISPGIGSLDELITDIVRLYPQVAVSVRTDPQLGEFSFDADQMRRVLINLMDNAVSAIEGANDPAITIALARAGDDARLVFSDNAPGIPIGSLDLIFEPYYTKRPGGSGIGLAIVKTIVLLHGGSIRVESREGAGASFIITLPLERDNVISPAGDRIDR